jgi:hypothetical protein
MIYTYLYKRDFRRVSPVLGASACCHTGTDSPYLDFVIWWFQDKGNDPVTKDGRGGCLK